MNLVQQEHQSAGKFRFFSDFLQALLAIYGGIKGPKSIFSCAGNSRCDRGLADAGWPVENHRGQAVGFNHATDDFPWSDQMLLADDLINAGRPHAQG